MTQIEQHISAMKTAEDLLAKHGVKQRGGKKYLEVKYRVQILREKYGLNVGINTEILHQDDKRVIIQAKIIDMSNRILGSGIAEELRGSNNVNTTSAIENGETSAIGRACSSLGLHGGEYASLNEMHAVNRKESILQNDPPAKPKLVVKNENIPDHIEDWTTWAAESNILLRNLKTETELRRWLADNESNLQNLKKYSETMYQTLGNSWAEFVENTNT